jgi:putative transcriptional regulator
MRHEVGRFVAVATCAVGLALALIAAGPVAARPGKAKPAKGMFLVASPRLMGPMFGRTVILLTQYGPKGAMGLVINRPTEVSIAHAVPDFSESPRSSEKIFIGGPVNRKGLFLLVKAKDEPKGSQHIFDGVYLGRSHDLLKKLIDDGDSDTVFRFYTGYAGFAPGQLDAELARGDWLVKPATADSLFFGNEQLWRNLLPPDPSWSAELLPVDARPVWPSRL